MNDIAEQCSRLSDQWFAELEDLFTSAAHHFGRREMQDRALEYLIGPLRPAERKNGWQPAEATDHALPYSVQHLLLRARLPCTPHRTCAVPFQIGCYSPLASARWLHGLLPGETVAHHLT